MTVACVGIPLALIALWSYAQPRPDYTPQQGDIIFQAFPPNALSGLIQRCTHSAATHCGVVLQENGEWVVIEGVGPVKETPLYNWIARGQHSAFFVERMPLTQPQSDALKLALKHFLGKPYDEQFEMSDDAIYCSELVYKGYKNGFGMEVGHLQKLGDLDWHSDEDLIRHISKDGTLPLDRVMITPASIASDPQLKRVYTWHWDEVAQ